MAPGFHLILLNGTWGADLEVKEISLAIDTPDGTILIVGCSHPTIEKIVQAAKNVTGKPIHLVLGGTHLLPAKDDPSIDPEQVDQIASGVAAQRKAIEQIAAGQDQMAHVVDRLQGTVAEILVKMAEPPPPPPVAAAVPAPKPVAAAAPAPKPKPKLTAPPWSPGPMQRY